MSSLPAAIRDRKDLPVSQVLVHSARTSIADMPRLYKAADAFVLPTHGEGWGLPLLEAMAMVSCYAALYRHAMKFNPFRWLCPLFVCSKCCLALSCVVLPQGLPVIATDWGGHLHFMNKHNSLLVPVQEMAPAHDPLARMPRIQSLTHLVI